MNRSLHNLLVVGAWAFVFVLLYQIAAWTVLPPSDGVAQWERNRIRFERFARQAQNPSAVIAGSSLAVRLPPGEIGPATASLAISAGSAETGVEVVASRKAQGEFLLVEVNETLLRSRDAGLVAAASNGWGAKLREYVSVFRTEYRPLAVLTDGLRWLRGGAPLAEGGDTGRPIDQALRARLVAAGVVAGKRLLSPDEQARLLAQTDRLHTLVAKAEASGWRPVFFQMPGELDIDATPRHQAIQSHFRQAFPEPRFRWITLSSKQRVTRDGAHLIDADAADVAREMRRLLQSVPP